jgi:uncharacterized membrane protein
VIDVMRGSSMLLVILAHTAWLVDRSTAPALPFLALIRFANLASIAFVFVSGTMVSYFLATLDRRRVVLRFARRAVFLLFVVHPVIWLASWFWFPGEPSAMLRAWYITDTIAACLLIGPALMVTVPAAGRMLLAALLPAAAVVARALWVPDAGIAAVARELLVGSRPSTTLYPLLPWLAVFLGGSVLGELLAKAGEDRQKFLALSARLKWAASALLGAGVVTVAVYKSSRIVLPNLWNQAWLDAVRPDRTTVLFPSYIGTLLLLLAFVIQRGYGRTGFGRFGWATSVIGRTSLFAFVVQFTIVWSLSAILGLRSSLTLVTIWPMFLFYVALIWSLCYAYGRLSDRVHRGEIDAVIARRRVPRVGPSVLDQSGHPLQESQGGWPMAGYRG